MKRLAVAAEPVLAVAAFAAVAAWLLAVVLSVPAEMFVVAAWCTRQ